MGTVKLSLSLRTASGLLKKYTANKQLLIKEVRSFMWREKKIFSKQERRILGQSTQYCGVGIAALAIEIIKVACKDYKNAVLTNNKKNIDTLEKFFYSHWFGVLSELDPEYVIERLKKAAQEESGRGRKKRKSRRGGGENERHMHKL